jgi:hypothetical protein
LHAAPCMQEPSMFTWWLGHIYVDCDQNASSLCPSMHPVDCTLSAYIINNFLYQRRKKAMWCKFIKRLWYRSMTRPTFFEVRAFRFLLRNINGILCVHAWLLHWLILMHKPIAHCEAFCLRKWSHLWPIPHAVDRETMVQNRIAWILHGQHSTR